MGRNFSIGFEYCSTACFAVRQNKNALLDDNLINSSLIKRNLAYQQHFVYSKCALKLTDSVIRENRQSVRIVHPMDSIIFST